MRLRRGGFDMLVRDILKFSADYLGLKSVKNYLNGDSELTDEVLEDLDNLLLSVNMVNNNIASSYIELNSTKELFVKNNLVKFTEISKRPIIEIKSIKNNGYGDIAYKVFPEGVEVEKVGHCFIEFTYFPDKVEIDSEINHYLKLNEMIFAMGVVGEFLFIKGAIDDAYMWDKRFKTAMFNLLRPRKNIVMPKRRWL